MGATTHRVLTTAAQGPQGPSYRLRCSALAAPLALHGVELVDAPLLTAAESSELRGANLVRTARTILAARRRLRRLSDQERGAAGTVVIQRQADFLPSLSLERRLARDRRLIFDVDDAIWLDASRAAGGHPLAFLKRSASKARWLAERANHVVTGNELLATYLARYNDSVSVVPTLIDTDAPVPPPACEGDECVLGWIGSPSTAPFLETIAPAIERVSRETGRALRLIVVGGPVPAVNGVAVEAIEWSEGAEYDVLGRMHIGLMPLPDTPWNRGKCAFKALRYMSAGVPTVADDVGVNAKTIGDGGLVVGSSDGWVSALTELIESPKARRAMGESGRRRVEAHYSFNRWGPELARIWAGMGPPTPPRRG